MDWLVLLAKGVFGLVCLLAYMLGLIDVNAVTSVILFLLAIDDIQLAYSLKKAEVEEG
ncbi:MAG: hypothetical protein QXT64_03160 [Desulfurococcaceae archaeon]